MEIPKHIKESIIKTAKYHEKANKHSNIVRNWLMKNNLYNDGNIDQLIDSCEQCNNPYAFINHIENNAFEGNDVEYDENNEY